MQKKFGITVFLIFAVLLTGMIDTSQSSGMSDDAIKRKIESEVGRTSGLMADKVRIAVENGYVVLYGTVDRYIHKILFEKVAWKTEGVEEVDNEIRVVPEFPQTDAAIERRIKEIVKTYRQFQASNIGVTVKAGAVKIRITLNHPADIIFLKNKIAEIAGVTSIDIMADFAA